MNNLNDDLFFAIAFIDHPGINGDFKAQIEKAIANGANVNGISKNGQTPLTAAIEGGMGSPSAVEILLQHGADPSKRDENGWTPWGICISRIKDPVVAKEMCMIKSLLEEENADRSDEIYLNFQQALLNGDFNAAKKFLDAGIDLSNQIIHPLHCAIEGQNIEVIKILLAADIDVDKFDKSGDNPLMYAAENGYQEIVELLVEYGVDITKYTWGDKRCTAVFRARENGHIYLANWLDERMSVKLQNLPSKYRVLYEKNIDGINYGLTTDDIVIVLKEWDRRYSISISDIEQSGFVVSFEKLPSKLSTLSKRIYDFCPDIIDQGYGCIDDMVRMAEESRQELSQEMLDLIDGFDFSNQNFGLELLELDLKKNKKVKLWWD